MKLQFYLLLLFSVLQRCLCVDLTYYVEEGKNPGTYLGDIAADSHFRESVSSQHQSLIRFSLLGQDMDANSKLFRVAKKTGKLYTTQTLDAETLCTHNSECFEMLKVAVRRDKTFTKIIKVKVVIQDVNDHQPEFPVRQVNIQFSEADGYGISKLIPNAVDKDVGMLNSQLNYQLRKHLEEPFTLTVSKSVDGMSDLSITLKERLDREAKDSYLIQVVAKDGGTPPKQSVLNVQITVTDINDNPPVFSQSIYNVSINYEHDLVTPVTILSARDLDSGPNGKISYQFSSKTSSVTKDQFRINRETGEIFLQKRFSSQQKPTYKLHVKATDSGSLPLTSIAMVLINVINQQNHAPTIDVNFVSALTDNAAAVSEDVEVGSFIAYVMVTDPDIGQNGKVTCDLNHDKFQLQSLGTKEYKVTIKDTLDRETKSHYEIAIFCQDGGSPPLQSESNFTIPIIDVNDVRPQFSKEMFKFRIFENQTPKYPVGTINASDPDEGPGGKLSYSLLSVNKQFLPFKITDEGFVSTIISLDHEFQNIYEFKVFVKDNGIPSLNNTANVIVEVRDENDNAPFFTFPSVNPFLLDILYYPHHTSNITILKASDLDSRENAFLKYEIISGNDKQLFSINHYTGLLSFSREVTHDDAGSHDLQLVVKDSGTPVLSATTSLIVTLTVSNKTFEMLNAEQVKPGKKIHLYLMIAIVVVTVAVSVAITASMSICLLRCKDRRNVPCRHRVNPPFKRDGKPEHYACPTYHTTYWSGAPGASVLDTDTTRNNLLPRSRGETHPTDETGTNQKPLKVKSPTSSNYVYQVSHFFSFFKGHVFIFVNIYAFGMKKYEKNINKFI